MNKEVKKIVQKGVIALLILGVIACLMFFSEKSKSSAPVAAESVLTGAEGYVYYNDVHNNILRRDVGTGDSHVIGKDASVLSAFENEVLVDTGYGLSVLSFDGKQKGETYEINTSMAKLTKDYVYYRHNETGHVMKFDRKSGATEEFMAIAVDKFIVYGNKVIFTTPARTMIYIYDTTTGMPMAFFADKNIVDFDIDEDLLVYSDEADSCKVSTLDLNDYSEDVVKGVKTKTLAYRNGKVIYLKNDGIAKKSYKLSVKDYNTH